MQALGRWMLSLATVGLLGALLTAVVPEKGRKTVRFAFGVWMIALTLQPIRSLSGFSAESMLVSYENALAERLRAAEQTADSGAAAMIVASAQAWCEESLRIDGVNAEVRLKYDMARDQFVGAEIVYQNEPGDAQRVAVATMIAAQTGVPETDQIHR